MDTIAKLKHSSLKTKPYPRAVRAHIVKMKATTKDTVEAALVDQSGSIKAVAYDGVLTPYTQNNVILIRQFQRGASCILILNKHTKVTRCPTLEDIPSEYIADAEQLIDSRDPTVVPIGAIHAREQQTVGKTVTIKGKVVEVSTNVLK